MDSSGVADVDDQGSGWFQVKKKHRSSSKFSIGKWIGGSSRQQANLKDRNSDNRNQPQASIPEKDSVHKISVAHSSTSKEDEKIESCLDKRVVGGDNGVVKSPPPKDITTTASKNTSMANGNLSDKNPIIMPKIKWGDLDDDLLDNETSSVSEIKFGEIGNDDLTVCETTSKPVISKEIVEVLTSSSDACPNIPTPIEDSLEENRNKTSEVVDADLEPAKVEFPCSTDETRLSTVKIDDVDTEVIIAEDTEASQSDQHLPEASRTSNSAVQEEGESKERFRERLWCFLFENLNRAVDELYLLCELECDLEQLNEAVLVLQEAESDFRELNVRVAEFDKLKKNTSRTVRSMKGDHRRPHALSWEGSYVLPSNFEEVATGVLRVLNNLALMDITFMQQMLARPDLKMEFFHIMSFLLTHCTNSWKVASDQVGLLLLESLLLLGYFSLFYPGNQAVLRWGNSPTILHKVCDLPFAFFSDPELMPILAGTLVAACFGCEQNKDVVQQELSTDMIISLIKSSKTTPGNSTEDLTKNSTLEPKKPSRSNLRNSRLLTAKNGSMGGSINRIGKLRSVKDGKISLSSEDVTSKVKMDGVLEGSGTLPLYARFPESFIERSEIFFS